jgi:hypothetical protein
METLINDVITFTERKIREGLLVWHEIPELDDEEMAKWWCTPEGDRETLFSIASMYSQFPPEGMSVGECRNKIEDILCEKYPQYCY